MSIADNIAARDALTALWGGGEPKLVMTAAQASEALFGWVYKGPGMPTKADVTFAIRRIEERFGNEEVVSFLHRFGVTTLKDLWIGMYREAIAFADATIQHDTPPSAGWSEGKPIKPTEEEL